MKEVAHVIEPEVEVGQKALAICGAKVKVEVLWDDVPQGHPICRNCVEVLIVASNEVNEVIASVQRRALLLIDAASAPTSMDDILDDAHAYHDKQVAKAEKKQAKKDESKSRKRLRKDVEKAQAALDEAQERLDEAEYEEQEPSDPPVAPPENGETGEGDRL